MKTFIYKGLYAVLLKLSNHFNSRLLSKWKILLGTTLLIILSACLRGGEREKEIDNPTCYDPAVQKTIPSVGTEETSGLPVAGTEETSGVIFSPP